MERITEEEVKNVVWNCDNSKSPGPDSFNFGFIKFCWEEIKKDVIRAVNNFEECGRWTREKNASFISLIPKVDNPQLLNDFRPISLVGCLYKIVAKILSLRMKMVLHKVIDVRQSTFLAGRDLMDSVLVANVVLEEVKRRKSSCIFVKVDYEKAYDSVDWDFIYYMLQRLGFCSKWIGWIRACLESSSISVLVNGSPTQEFKPRRGLRQGDPLEPFLFLIVAEGLAGMERKAVEKEMFQSLTVEDKQVKVNMLQYTDNTFFFCKVNPHNAFVIKVMLNCFELASGLNVNYMKSHIGGVGCNQHLIQSCATILNCKVKKTPFNYLGMPIGASHKRRCLWEGVVESVRKRLGRSLWRATYV